ncbi:MAG TPA: hypothetical protein VEY91_12190 [Candidatus Limnocylindria bacterium]|nr:hypothetical protein [Candidatus Limnocylindria bacterium]
MPRTFVILEPESKVQDFVSGLRAAGGHASVVYPPHAAVIYADDDVLGRANLRVWIAESHRSPIDVSILARHGDDVQRAASVWNAALELTSHAEAHGDLEDRSNVAHGFVPDAGPRPIALNKSNVPDRTAVSDNLPLGAQYYDTSEFMAGSTAVGVWLIETASGFAYDWTPAEETQTLAGVQAALDNWVSKGGIATFLTFYLDIHTQVPVNGVPIENPISWDQIWMDEVLTNVGWPGANAFEKAFAYNTSIRDAFDTNWCGSIVIVDSDPSVNQGLFQGGGYAWAYYGGPWVYMSRYSTWAFNSPRYWDAVPMHEMGHIFMDSDEYDGFQQFQGYLNAPDTQSPSVQCIMNQNDPSRVCQPTRNQLGWRDLNGNFIIEPLDTAPAATLAPHLPDPTSNPTPTWSGTASIVTIPNQNLVSNYLPPHAMSIATIDLVEGRVDGGAWTTAVATDGAFDDYNEAFTWTAPPLADGVHVVEARAHTSVGRYTAAFPSDTIVVTGSPVDVQDLSTQSGQLALAPSSPSPMRDSAVLRFTLPVAGHARLAIYGADGSRVRMLMDRELPAGPSSVVFDGRDDHGRELAAGVYFGRLESLQESRTRKLVVIR